MTDTATKPADQKEAATAPKIGAKKDSTIELPMFDLNEALNFVSQVHEKALETQPMPKVAEGMGYTHPSSTPFYRRMVAARLFGLVGKSGAELSSRARAYLKPDSDTARARALQEAVTAIPAYAEEIQRYTGKKMGLQFVANSFATKLGLTDPCGMICAKAFEASVRMAGLIAPDGTVGANPGPKVAPLVTPAADGQGDEPQQQLGTRSHVLPLAKGRSVTVNAPLDMNKKEVDRVKRWLDVTLLIEGDEENPFPAANPPAGQ